MNEKKMVSQPGEMSFIPSQCSNCLYNRGGQECMIYGIKPEEFMDNKETCPEYEKEGE